MLYLMSILGYGDSLITGSILEYGLARRRRELRTVGTGITKSSWALLRAPLAPDIILFPDLPAFYSIRERGAAAATRDVMAIRRWARRNLTRWDTVILEHPDRLRGFIIMGSLGRRLVAPALRDSAYRDRSDFLARELGCEYVWKPAKPASGAARRLLVNPRGRAKSRAIPVPAVRAIVRVAKHLQCEMTLLDPYGHYVELKTEVGKYITKQPLPEVSEALRAADRYIGPDSFFSHLAYYFGVPQISIFSRSWLYFVPPGLSEAGGVVFEDEVADECYWERKLERFIRGE